MDWDGIRLTFNPDGSPSDYPTINNNFIKLLRPRNFLHFGVAIDYDAGRYYVGESGPGIHLFPNRADALNAIRNDLTFAISTFGKSSSYLRFNSVPVIFVFDMF